MSNQRRIEFVVAFDVPKGATPSECAEYVMSAVSCYRGSLRPPGGYSESDPGDPMQGLNSKSIIVKRFLKKQRRNREA